jgi:outer membrane protein W
MNFKLLKHGFLICLIQAGLNLIPLPVVGQSNNVSTSEIGLALGGLNYKGELSPNYRFLNNQPALAVFYRKDISQPITLKGSVLLSHRIVNNNTFNDKAFDLPLHNYRQAEAAVSVIEISAVGEYNFLDYYDFSQKVRISPYFFGGVSGMIYDVRLTTENDDLKDRLEKPSEKNAAVSIPFGVGVKYALSKHWNLGLEFGARKLFTDQADNLFEKDGKRLANPYLNDWLFFNGVSVSYTIYKIKCPNPYKNNPGMLD